jgi:AsmA family protein
LVCCVSPPPPPPPSPAPPPDGKVLPSERFDHRKLKAADGDITLRAERIVTSRLPLENMSTHLRLDAGVLKLAPLDFSVAGGEVMSSITMDARNAVIVTHADLTAQKLHLDDLFAGTKLKVESTGLIGAKARLDGNGDSVAQILASATGNAVVVGEGGSISELTLRLSNLDLAHALGLVMRGDRQAPIQCMSARLDAVNGDFKVSSFILDTPKVQVGATGDLDFHDEKLNLVIASQAKGFSPLSLRGPLLVTGSLKSPVVHPDMHNVIKRAVMAMALAVPTAGLGLFVPLVDPGKKPGNNCVRLEEKGAAPPANGTD